MVRLMLIIILQSFNDFELFNCSESSSLLLFLNCFTYVTHVWRGWNKVVKVKSRKRWNSTRVQIRLMQEVRWGDCFDFSISLLEKNLATRRLVLRGQGHPTNSSNANSSRPKLFNFILYNVTVEVTSALEESSDKEQVLNEVNFNIQWQQVNNTYLCVLPDTMFVWNLKNSNIHSTWIDVDCDGTTNYQCKEKSVRRISKLV